MEKLTGNSKKEDKEYYYTGNGLADIMRAVAGILVVIGIIGGLIMLKDSEVIGVSAIISSILLGMFTYCQAEKLEILSDIRENTEYLRDNINNEDK